jgi:hypothetical protein
MIPQNQISWWAAKPFVFSLDVALRSDNTTHIGQNDVAIRALISYAQRIETPVRPSESLAFALEQVFPYSEGMEVHFTPELQAKIDQLVIETGRAPDKLLEDAMAGYVAELVQTREMLNSRYDDLKSGRVKPISGDEVIARLREKSAARRSPPGS